MRDEEAHIQATDSGTGLEFISEVSDLADGAGLLAFALAPLALPVPALTTLLALPLLLATLVGVLVAVPIVCAVQGGRRASARSHALEGSVRHVGAAAS